MRVHLLRTPLRNTCVLGGTFCSFLGQAVNAMDNTFLWTNLSQYLDDRTLCQLSCAERLSHRLTCEQRQHQQQEQPLTVRLKGRTECEVDCASIALLLQYSETAPFVGQVFWVDDAETIFDKLLHVELTCQRKTLLSLHRAVKIFLEDLQQIEVLYMLRETLTFSDEFTGVRAYDDGKYHRADVCNRLVAKASHKPKEALDLLG